MKYFFFLVPICVLFALGGAEIFFRFTTGTQGSAVNGRWLEPYLAFGNFKGGHPASPPSAAGYEPDGMVYKWRPDANVTSVLSRAPVTFGEDFPLSPDRNPGTKWVMVVGGSAALGDGSEAKRFPFLLEEGLKRNLPNVSVFKAATRSFNSTQERIALELYVLPLRPDAVIFLHGFNDANQAESMARPGDPYNMGITYGLSENFLFGLLRLFSTYSRFVDQFVSSSVLKTLSEGRGKMSLEDRQNFARSNASVYVDNVRKMAKRCDQENIRCLFLFQPFRDFLGESGDESVRMVYRQVIEELSRRPLAGRAVFRDMAAHYANRRDLFVDLVHMNEKGQSEIAQAAIALLSSELGFRPGGRTSP